MMEIIWQIVEPILGELAVLAMVLGGIFGLIRKGRNDQRRDDELKRAKADAEAYQDRREIDVDVAKEPDLVDRAHRAGVVRGRGRSK